jgi:CheY-like chemotaxis protein
MPRDRTLAPPGQTVRPPGTAARKLALAGRTCSNCGSYDIRPSNSRNALDILLACVFLSPFRCRHCRERFYRFGRPSLFRPAPPVAPLLVIPARRQAANVEPISPPRIEPETLRPPRNLPHRMPPGRKSGPPRSAFIERLETGMRSPQPLPTLPPGAVLILAGDLSIRKLLRRLVERRGYQTIETAESGQLAAELERRPVDLLVVDVADTGVHGIHGVLELARVHPDLKVLAIASEPLQDNQIPGRLLTLLKPFPLDRFMECVDRLLQR